MNFFEITYTYSIDELPVLTHYEYFIFLLLDVFSAHRINLIKLVFEHQRNWASIFWYSEFVVWNIWLFLHLVNWFSKIQRASLCLLEV